MSVPGAAAVISDVRVVAAHGGVAELVVVLRHRNGGTSDVTLDRTAAAALFEVCKAASAEELVGAPWERVRDALAVSWNRYN